MKVPEEGDFRVTGKDITQVREEEVVVVRKEIAEGLDR